MISIDLLFIFFIFFFTILMVCCNIDGHDRLEAVAKDEYEEKKERKRRWVQLL